ncbi:hypothetical protein [uncultured Methylobacterium sp.]|uniref:hypothetical protein n=1 Tax=uncultured Methylobacterium sp. TaxID=157278 RepID=UPI00260C76FB|nr:hypothetical protein [uncultured Methylobacterium sp.]
MIARRSIASAALLAALVLAGPVTGPAAAQVYGYTVEEVDAVLSPRAVLARLGRQGYAPLSHPRFDGETYTLDAESPGGNPVRLVVDARSGRILDRDRLEAPLYPPAPIPSGRRPGYGWTEEARGFDPESDPRQGRGVLLPPGSIPMPGERAGPRIQAVRPPVEPAPRLATREAPPTDEPRPAVAAPARPAGPNPLGLNPDSPAGRGARSPEGSEAAPRKPPRPAAISPAAIDRRLQATPPAEAKPAQPATPPAAEARSGDIKSAEAKSGEAKFGESKPATGWTTPPDGNRPVRVIGGVTQVPGKDETAPKE